MTRGVKEQTRKPDKQKLNYVIILTLEMMMKIE